MIAKNVNALVDDIHAKYDAVCDAVVAFNKRIPPKDSENDMVITFNTVINKSEKFTEDDDDFNWVNENLEKFGEVKIPVDLKNDAIGDDGKLDLSKLNNLLLANMELQMEHYKISRARKPIVEISEALRIAADELTTSVTNLKSMDKDKFDLNGINEDKVEVDTAVGIIKDLELTDTINRMTLTELKGKTYGKEIMKYSDRFWSSQKKAMSRYAVYKYLKDLSSIDSKSTKINSEKDALNNDYWNEFVKSLNMPSKYTTKIEAAASFVNEHFNPFSGFIDDQAQWANGFEGKILMSDSANRTASFDENQNLTYTKNRNFYEENLTELRNELKKI